MERAIHPLRFSVASVSSVCVCLFVLLNAPSSYAQILNEEKVVELLRKDSVLLQQTIAEKAATQLNSALLEESYGARLKTSYAKQKSNEEPLISFQPIVSPYEEVQLNIEKRLSIGAQLKAGLFANNSNLQDGSLVNDTQVGAMASAQIDLWKNIFGRLDRARLNVASQQKNFAEKQAVIKSKQQEVQMRKLYWSLAASDQNLILSEELLKSAERQAADAEKRFKLGAADRSELSKYRSQVESRKATLLLYKYEKEMILHQFEKIMNQFKSDQYEISKKDFDLKQTQVNQCLKLILQPHQDLKKYTDIDELVDYVKSEKESEMKLAHSHAGPDVQLLAQYQTSARSNSFEQAQTELEDEKKSSYTLGLQVTIPLDGSSGRSEDQLKLLKSSSLSAKLNSLENEFNSTHQKMVSSVQLLMNGLSTQSSNSKNLDINYAEVRKKYQQGRIPLAVLISEQDLLFQSQLQEINLKKQIAHAILDYFSVFNHFPCDWNNLI